jgi:predicted phosphate transport protein (TIGR00153 family)
LEQIKPKMSLNSIFQYFLPKDKKFFPLFESASANLITLSNYLVEAVNASDLEHRNELIKKIDDLEHRGDEITHEIFLELSKNFITPFDREDIHALASAIDDVADYIHGSANRMLLYNLNYTTDPIKKLAELISQGCKDIDKAVKELKDLKHIRNVTDSCVRINSMENQADYVFDMAVADLFKNETNAIELFKMKEILSALETATDKCEDAANVMESIIVKHA